MLVTKTFLHFYLFLIYTTEVNGNWNCLVTITNILQSIFFYVQ